MTFSLLASNFCGMKVIKHKLSSLALANKICSILQSHDDFLCKISGRSKKDFVEDKQTVLKTFSMEILRSFMPNAEQQIFFAQTKPKILISK
jgi:hypothetical protein